MVTRMSSSGDTGTALSILNIDQVHLTDKGNYTCKPASGGQASISLHVLEGRELLLLLGSLVEWSSYERGGEGGGAVTKTKHNPSVLAANITLL